MSKKFITFEERQKIEEYLKQNLSLNEIAEKIGFAERTISEEKRKGQCEEGYSALVAEKEAKKRKQQGLLRSKKNINNDISKKRISFNELLVRIYEKINYVESVVELLNKKMGENHE